MSSDMYSINENVRWSAVRNLIEFYTELIRIESFFFSGESPVTEVGEIPNDKGGLRCGK